ncbi:MAG: HNH endonuclease, partial [Bdellovibrionales bacterium]|nr:HNH endonuclease [Bdellovibrionales bacterium]
KEAKIKKFGKKRVTNSEKTPTLELENQSHAFSDELAINNIEKSAPYKTTKTKNLASRNSASRNSTKKDIQAKSQNPCYISKKLKYHIWQRDGGRCTKCGSRQHLNVDHVKPVALGGEANSENLRLLCQPCNQRQAIRIFGLNHVENLIKI